MVILIALGILSFILGIWMLAAPKSEEEFQTVEFIGGILVTFSVTILLTWAILYEDVYNNPEFDTTLEQEYWLKKNDMGKYSSFDTLWTIKLKYDKINRDTLIKKDEQ